MIVLMSTQTNLKWPTFNSPALSVSIPDIHPFQWLTHMNRLKHDGYTIFKELLPPDIFDPLNRAFDDLKSAQILPVGIITHPFSGILFAHLIQSLKKYLTNLMLFFQKLGPGTLILINQIKAGHLIEKSYFHV